MSEAIEIEKTYCGIDYRPKNGDYYMSERYCGALDGQCPTCKDKDELGLSSQKPAVDAPQQNVPAKQRPYIRSGWMVYYDGSEGHPANFMYPTKIYESEEAANRGCLRAAYTPKKVYISEAPIQPQSVKDVLEQAVKNIKKHKHTKIKKEDSVEYGAFNEALVVACKEILALIETEHAEAD